MIFFPKYVAGLKRRGTYGKIIDVNVSFQDHHGNFYHGAFVVASTEQSSIAGVSDSSDISSASNATETKQPFALPGDSGAAVVDRQSNIVLGIAVATLENYVSPFKHVTFCLRLNYALDSLYDKHNLRVGTFRTFES